MKRPSTTEFAPYYANYVNQVPEGDIVALLRSEHQQTQELLKTIAAKDGDYRYAEGKWSIKELLQHMIDTEQIMAYRALRFARKDKTPLPGFDQDDYIDVLDCSTRPLNFYVKSWAILREYNLLFFNQLQEQEWEQVGEASNCPFSVKALAYIIVGHEIHHRKVLKERYLVKNQ